MLDHCSSFPNGLPVMVWIMSIPPEAHVLINAWYLAWHYWSVVEPLRAWWEVSGSLWGHALSGDCGTLVSSSHFLTMTWAVLLHHSPTMLPWYRPQSNGPIFVYFMDWNPPRTVSQSKPFLCINYIRYWSQWQRADIHLHFLLPSSILGNLQISLEISGLSPHFLDKNFR
jgi:hypothetical protein